ncbi:hypothetical protein TIFTF001_033070 [Ficus carica]|uniref:Uncharacterized protein n=1 Tax=Ficus carica TaxID=3494 RepID=A0AA88J775_FICCA|nr:hypothetical protein TIFTF001_033070 [Ficus carica]
MPRKSSGETYFWDNAKEKKSDELLSYSGGALGFGQVTMRDGSNPYVEAEVSMDNSGTQPVLDEELTLTNGGRQGVNRRAGDEAGPSRSRGSSGNESKKGQQTR